MTLERRTFEAVLGPLQEIIDKSARARDAAARNIQREQQQAGLSTADRSCFKLRRKLCEQANGAVLYLAAHVRTGTDADENSSVATKEYTLRLESIGALAAAGSQEEVLAEVALLKGLPIMMNSKRVASLPPLLSTFRDERALYWVFTGRTLCTVQQMAAHAHLDEPSVTFVLACVVAAVNALHAQRVLLRSVAAPLLMVDDAGYVVVVDFRQSRKLEGEWSYSMAGLPQYLAPEQVRGAGHSFPVDWWALGVLLYEMTCGVLPFHCSDVPDQRDSAEVDELAVARNILKHSEDSLDFDGCQASEMMQGLIRALLAPDPQQRLGTEGSGAVEDSEVLLGVNWSQINGGQAQSPLAPRVADVIRASSTSAGRNARPSVGVEVQEPNFEKPASNTEWLKKDFSFGSSADSN